VKETKERRKERQATGKPVEAREEERSNSPAHQLQYPCFFRRLPVAKEAHVSCLLVSGYYWLQKDLQV